MLILLALSLLTLASCQSRAKPYASLVKGPHTLHVVGTIHWLPWFKLYQFQESPGYQEIMALLESSHAVFLEAYYPSRMDPWEDHPHRRDGQASLGLSLAWHLEAQGGALALEAFKENFHAFVGPGRDADLKSILAMPPLPASRYFQEKFLFPMGGMANPASLDVHYFLKARSLGLPMYPLEQETYMDYHRKRLMSATSGMELDWVLAAKPDISAVQQAFALLYQDMDQYLFPDHSRPKADTSFYEILGLSESQVEALVRKSVDQQFISTDREAQWFHKIETYLRYAPGPQVITACMGYAHVKRQPDSFVRLLRDQGWTLVKGG